MARNLSDSPVLSQLIANSPQTVTAPISFQLINLRPFDQPLYASIGSSMLTSTDTPYISASVVIFTGLIFVMILSFFIMVGFLLRF